MSAYSNELKEALSCLIDNMKSSPAAFVKSPEKNFTRDRKLPFQSMMQMIISMGGNSIYKELLEAQGYTEDMATTSAFIQQRDKILPYAFEFLFREFTKKCSENQHLQGYRLLAVDGSSLRIAPISDDDGTFVSQSSESGYCAIHLNAMYD